MTGWVPQVLVDTSLDNLREMMGRLGVRQLLLKELAPNDNSKNQLYFGGSLEILNQLPIGPVMAEKTASGKDRLKTLLPFFWLRSDGTAVPAPGAQLILYPQYPEVRLSGFLKGVQGGPNAVMTSRDPGRLLLLGITTDRRIIAFATAAQSRLSSDIRALGQLLRKGVFQHIPIGSADTDRGLLLTELRRISRLDWISSKRLSAVSEIVPCKGTNCGGYTLEAELGVLPNSSAEPDFDGWEIKAHAVDDFSRDATGSLTLMTPQPTGGIYHDQGAEVFIRHYGYSDKSGKPDRLNFSSPHRYGIRNENTGLMLQFIGFDPTSQKITDVKGGFALIDNKGREAATWHFGSLIEHWSRKHAKAAYVPYRLRLTPKQQYCYSRRVRLGEGTDFVRFLTAMSENKVIYDPGIKLEGASTKRPRIKHRNQFRIKYGELDALYSRMELVDLP